jgi:hypothetical protein
MIGVSLPCVKIRDSWRQKYENGLYLIQQLYLTITEIFETPARVDVQLHALKEYKNYEILIDVYIVGIP